MTIVDTAYEDRFEDEYLDILQALLIDIHPMLNDEGILMGVYWWLHWPEDGQ